MPRTPEPSVRMERDPLGTREVPAGALYGIQTLRALENFPISGLKPLPAFVDAVVQIKRAAALANGESGRLPRDLADAIIAAADEVLAGAHRDQFVVDVYQAGAGTSHNMNVNEVLANLANERLGHARGTYAPVHPNDHVNMAQSTNDVIPTAIRLGVLTELTPFAQAAKALATALTDQGGAFDHIIKAGRTHLQDAMPIRLGQEFAAWGHTMTRALQRVLQSADFLRDLGIGGTAVGTGVNAERSYPSRVIAHLKQSCGFALREGTDRVQLMQSMGDVAAFSGALRAFALDLSKIASDLRLLASGPRTGLAEIVLPAVQPGSSIMPGKVNPSVPEMVNQVCFQVMGNDAAVAIAAEHGQLELNVMMPVIAHNVLFSMEILRRAVETLNVRCVQGIAADEAMCAYWVERSAALATALAPSIGYARAAELSKASVASGELIRDLAAREQVLPPNELREMLDLRRLTELGVPGQPDKP
ncbi:MAG: aspartate ammonia-lyase [Gemmatimonadetes bacterium]|nr:aspartate ammonia-lyase [Gemmatimonadota bacterium]